MIPILLTRKLSTVQRNGVRYQDVAELRSPTKYNIRSSSPSKIQRSALDSHKVIELFKQQQLKSGYPLEVKTLTSVLVACTDILALEEGRQVHNLIRTKGIQINSSLGSALIRMYGKCQRTEEAYQVFMEMRKNRSVDVWTWNSMISAYRQAKLPRKAINLFQELQREGNLHFDSYTLSSVLGACSDALALAEGRAVHKIILAKGRIEPLIGNTLINMYGVCNRPDEASEVFDQMKKERALDIISWTSMIAAYRRCNSPQKAIQLFKQMQQENPTLLPDSQLLVSVLGACADAVALEEGLSVHKIINSKGMKIGTQLGNALINMYGRCYRSKEAYTVFAEMKKNRQTDIRTWNSMLNAYRNDSAPDEAIQLFKRMQAEDDSSSCNVYIMASVLAACADACALEEGRTIHKIIETKGIKLDNILGNALLTMYGKCGGTAEAERVFNDLRKNRMATTSTWTHLITAYRHTSKFPQKAIDLFKQMQAEGVAWDSSVLVPVLGACGDVKNLDEGRAIHQIIRDSNAIADVRVGNGLISMYGNCGESEEAYKIFRVMVQDNHTSDLGTWIAMIEAYRHCNEPQHAIHLFKQMKSREVSPDARILAAVLAACADTMAMDEGRAVHKLALSSHAVQMDTILGNALINFYSKCGCPEDSYNAFKYMRENQIPLNLTSWNLLLASLRSTNLPSRSIELFKEMQDQRLPIDSYTISSLLSTWSEDRTIHESLLSHGVRIDPILGNALLTLYAKHRYYEEAEAVFKEMEKNQTLDPLSWNNMITVYQNANLPAKALQLFKRMEKEQISFNHAGLVSLLEACTATLDLEAGRTVHRSIRTRDIPLNTFLGTSLITMYGKCGSPDEANSIFKEIMEKGIADGVSLGAMLLAYQQAQLPEKGIQLFNKTHAALLPIHDSVLTLVLAACARAHALEEGRKIHSFIRSRADQDLNSILGNALINMYAKCGSPQEVESVFKEMQSKQLADTISWTCMIEAYRTSDQPALALQLFHRMQKQQIPFDNYALVSVLTAAADAVDLETGKQIHHLITTNQVKMDPILATALVDMYGKCACPGEAANVFQRVPKSQNTPIWNAMINAYGQSGLIQAAIRTFKEMQDAGVKPDATTFTCLLNACSHSGLVQEALKYLDLMETQFGIPSTSRHYVCIIDALARAGRLEEAETWILTKLDPPVDVIIWNCLLSGCRTFQDVERAERVFEWGVAADPTKTSLYVSMSNIYRVAGRTKDAERVREMMESAGLKKFLGLSSIYVMGQVHNFQASDTKHPESAAVKAFVREYLVGYVPNTAPFSSSNSTSVNCDKPLKSTGVRRIFLRS